MPYRHSYDYDFKSIKFVILAHQKLGNYPCSYLIKAFYFCRLFGIKKSAFTIGTGSQNFQTTNPTPLVNATPLAWELAWGKVFGSTCEPQKS